MKKSSENEENMKSIFQYTKLSFKSKKLWKVVLIPPIIPSVFSLVVSIIAKQYGYIFKEMYPLVIYFGLCFFIFIFAIIIDFTQATYKIFIKENIKGKIVLILIFLFFIIKALYEILR